MTLPNTIDMLTRLVGEPSVSCTNAALDQSNVQVIAHLANWLDDLGFDVEVVDLPPTSPDRPAKKANLIARRGSGEDGLVFAGHTDTVPCDESLWDADPFALAERGDKFYGLGSCDMKGFFPLALGAVAQFRDAELTKPLMVVATSDEESSMHGARYFEEQGFPRAAAAVIGEPTDMQPIRAHKGVMLLSIEVQGASGHASNPGLGHNALDGMQHIMAALMTFRESLKERHVLTDFEVAHPTLNLGCLHAGDNPNRICSHAELQIDFRLMPGMDAKALQDEIAELAIHAAADFPVTVQPVFPTIPPYQTAADGELVRKLEQLSGRGCGTVAFGTEAPFFQNLGMETVVFGAGSINQAHQPNEYLPAEHIEPTQAVLAGLIDHYCR